MYTITISERGKPPVKLDFDKPEVTIGRVRGNDIVLQKNNVSKRHAKIVVKDEQFIIFDQESTNGTIVNAKKLTVPQVVQFEDKICIGDFILTVNSQGADSVLAETNSQLPDVPPIPTNITAPALDEEELRGLIDDANDAEALPADGDDSMKAQDTDDENVEDNEQADPEGDVPEAADDAPQEEDDMEGDNVAALEEDNAEAEVSSEADAAADSSPQQEVSQGPDTSTRSQISNPFALAQAVCFQQIMENIQEDTLPASYPPDEDVRDTFLKPVKDGLDSLSADGALDGLDRGALEEVLLNEICGLGPLETLLENEAIQSVYVNAFDRILLRHNGRLIPAQHHFSTEKALEIVTDRLTTSNDATVEADLGTITTQLPMGFRVEVLLPPITEKSPVITLNRTGQPLPSLSQLVHSGGLSEPMAMVLEAAMFHGRNILISGPDPATRTAMANALCRSLPDQWRTIMLEVHPLINHDQSGTVQLVSGPLSAPADSLLSQAANMNPDYLVIDGLSRHGTFDWLLLCGIGGVGSLVTSAGNDANSTLKGLETMAMSEAGGNALSTIQQHLADTIDIMVMITPDNQGLNRVSQISDVAIGENGNWEFTDSFTGDGEGGFVTTGHVLSFCSELNKLGTGPDPSIFKP